MSREFCYNCHRAKVACLCDRIEKQINRVNVIVLQHPDEANNPKGSAIIAKLGLKQYKCWKGEDFSQNRAFKELIDTVAEDILLLYPSEQATELCVAEATNIKYLLVIDATGRKARRIWEKNPCLHSLKTARLAQNISSNYRIRKAPRTGYLSTVESIVVALRELELQPQAYKPLLQLFDEMIDFQIKNMGSETYKENYRK
jgi:DTW domain-containing protein YfiP